MEFRKSRVTIKTKIAFAFALSLTFTSFTFEVCLALAVTEQTIPMLLADVAPFTKNGAHRAAWLCRIRFRELL